MIVAYLIALVVVASAEPEPAAQGWASMAAGQQGGMAMMGGQGMASMAQAMPMSAASMGMGQGMPMSAASMGMGQGMPMSGMAGMPMDASMGGAMANMASMGGAMGGSMPISWGNSGMSSMLAGSTMPSMASMGSSFPSMSSGGGSQLTWSQLAPSMGMASAGGSQSEATIPGDHNRNCPSWAARGECGSNPRYMNVHCSNSCMGIGAFGSSAFQQMGGMGGMGGAFGGAMDMGMGSAMAGGMQTLG